MKKKVSLNALREHPNNPRTVKDEKFMELVTSIRNDPEFMKLHPLIVKDGVVWAGNQRLKALRHEGYTEIPGEWVIDGSEFTETKLKKFMLLDNVHAGEFDTELLADDYFEDIDFGEIGLGDFEPVGALDIEGVEPEKGEKPENQPVERYKDETIKEITLLYHVDKHGQILELLEDIAAERGLEDNSETVEFLLDFYINNK